MLRWQVIALGVIALASLGSNLCRGRHGHPRRAIASVVTTVYMVNKRHHGGLNPALAMASTCYSCSPIPGGQRRLLDPASFSRLPTVLCSASLRSRHQRNTSLTLLHPFCTPSAPLLRSFYTPSTHAPGSIQRPGDDGRIAVPSRHARLRAARTNIHAHRG